MSITISKPWAISEKGGRLNNEDSIYPQPEVSHTNQRLFLVCDGVGGAERGEVASSLACESFQTYFHTFSEKEPTKEFIDKAVGYVETRFDEYILTHPSAKGMATTLTMAYIGVNGITLAHIGDSRIYHFRNGKILYQTEDHSLVNNLIKLGRITSEEAKKHPQRHVITRAIQGSKYATKSDVVFLKDIQAGDFIFMCSDGVLEHLTNEDLSAIFASNNTESIKDEIMTSCSGRTKDNYSFYIIPIQNVFNSAGLKQNILSFLYSFI